MGYDNVLATLRNMMAEEAILVKALPYSGQSHKEKEHALRVAVAIIEELEKDVRE